jgi:hypothetical protein
VLAASGTINGCLIAQDQHGGQNAWIRLPAATTFSCMSGQLAA